MKSANRILSLLRLSSIVVPLLMTSGCVFDDMKEDTHDVKNTAADLKKTTDGIAVVSKNLDKVTADMHKDLSDLKAETSEQLKNTRTGILNTYADLRQKEAVDMRNQMLETLERTPSLESKAVTAGKYCMAFEFQLWKSNLNDSPEYREQLFRDGMEEFFLDLARFLPDPSEALDPTSSKPRSQNFMAIASTIDGVNPNAQILARQRNEPEVSILSLIHDGLKKAQQVESGEISHAELKPFEQQVLIYQRQAIALLQARVNFLPVMLLSRISDIQSRALPIQAWMAYYGSTAKFENIEAITQGLEFISSANEEIRFLKSVGVEVQMNSTIRSLYKNMTLPEPGKSERSMRISSDKRGVRTAVEAALVKEINQFKAYTSGT